MHHIDTNKMQREKARCEPNSSFSLKQILEETPHKTAAVWPPASHLRKHSRRTKQAGYC